MNESRRKNKFSAKNLIGIDYGEKMVGIAFSIDGIYASSLATVFTNEALARIAVICKEKECELIVVGMPQGRLVEKVREFGKALEKETHIAVEFFDETLSSQEAQRQLISQGGSRKKRKEKEHSVSASLILQSYLYHLH